LPKIGPLYMVSRSINSSEAKGRARTRESV